jgi:hypothetical protein
LEKNMRALVPITEEEEVRLPLFSGEASGVSVDPLVPKSPKAGHLGSRVPAIHPGGSLEVGRLPPEVERNLPTGNRTIAEARTTTHTKNGNEINGSATGWYPLYL